MKLYFLRHGLAADRDEGAGDADRSLTLQGREKMVRQAAAMARLGLEVDLIMTSPLLRARQTADIVASKLKVLDKLVQDKRLGPGFGPGHLADILGSSSGAKALMLVGHEPDMSETISFLIGGGRVLMKKGGLARVDICSVTELRGELIWLIPPAVMVL